MVRAERKAADRDLELRAAEGSAVREPREAREVRAAAVRLVALEPVAVVALREVAELQVLATGRSTSGKARTRFTSSS